MGRKRTHLKLTSLQKLQLERLLGTVRDPRQRERLGFVHRASTGRRTLDDLALDTGRSRSTIQNWLTKFVTGGLDDLLKRDSAPGRESPMATKRIQGQLTKLLKSGQLKTASQVSSWLKQEHGIKMARKSVYYWLNKNARSRQDEATDPSPNSLTKQVRERKA